MTTWWWIRHGPTHEKAFVGWRDVPADLSDTAKISRLNAFLPDTAVVVASDLSRASTTADTLSQGRSRLPDTASIREMNFGDWDGLTWDAVAKRDPDLSRAFWEEPGDVRAPNGESWHDTSARMSDYVNRLNAKHTGHIIAVAHFGLILTALQKATGHSPYETLAQPIDNLSVTKLTHHDGRWTVELVNHLP